MHDWSCPWEGFFDLHIFGLPDSFTGLVCNWVELNLNHFVLVRMVLVFFLDGI